MILSNAKTAHGRHTSSSVFQDLIRILSYFRECDNNVPNGMSGITTITFLLDSTSSPNNSNNDDKNINSNNTNNNNNNDDDNNKNNCYF